MSDNNFEWQKQIRKMKKEAEVKEKQQQRFSSQYDSEKSMVFNQLLIIGKDVMISGFTADICSDIE